MVDESKSKKSLASDNHVPKSSTKQPSKRGYSRKSTNKKAARLDDNLDVLSCVLDEGTPSHAPVSPSKGNIDPNDILDVEDYLEEFGHSERVVVKPIDIKIHTRDTRKGSKKVQDTENTAEASAKKEEVGADSIDVLAAVADLGEAKSQNANPKEGQDQASALASEDDHASSEDSLDDCSLEGGSVILEPSSTASGLLDGIALDADNFASQRIDVPQETQLKTTINPKSPKQDHAAPEDQADADISGVVHADEHDNGSADSDFSEDSLDERPGQGDSFLRDVFKKFSQVGDSDSPGLQHASGKEFDIRDIFDDLKYLSPKHAEKLKEEYLSGFSKPLKGLLNANHLERLGGSEFGEISEADLLKLVKKVEGKLTPKVIDKFYQLFEDIPNANKYLDSYHLKSTDLFSRDCPLTVLMVDTDELYAAEDSLKARQLRVNLLGEYTKHEAVIFDAIREYKFDPTNTEYQELMFYYYVLATKTDQYHYFATYQKLVDLQNLFLLYKLLVGSFESWGDFDLILRNSRPDFRGLNFYYAQDNLEATTPMHFMYLLHPLKAMLATEMASEFLSFINKICYLACNTVKQLYFPNGMPYDMDFMSQVQAYLMGIVTSNIGQKKAAEFDTYKFDDNYQYLYCYDVFMGAEFTSIAKVVPEFSRALEDLGEENIKQAINSKQLTPEITAWAVHINHQNVITETLADMGLDDFKAFKSPLLGYGNLAHDHAMTQIMSFYSRFLINSDYKRNFVNNIKNKLIDALYKRKYVEAFSSEFTTEALAVFRTMLTKRRGLFTNLGKPKGLRAEAELQLATDVLGPSVLELLRDGSKKQLPNVILPEELDALENLKLTSGEKSHLSHLIFKGVKVLYQQHLSENQSMNLSLGQQIGDIGVIPIIPGTSAHTAFLIARAMHFGDFGLHNYRWARLAYFYSDMLGHYLASMYTATLYGPLFDSTFTQNGRFYGASLCRAIYAGYLTANTDDCLYRRPDLEKHKIVSYTDYFTIFDDEYEEYEKKKNNLDIAVAAMCAENSTPTLKAKEVEEEEEKEIDPLDPYADDDEFSEFANFEKYRDFELGSDYVRPSLGYERPLVLFNNNVSMYTNEVTRDNLSQVFALLDDKYADFFRKIDPNFSINNEDEGVVLERHNEFLTLLSNAIIYMTDLLDQSSKKGQEFLPVLCCLLDQLRKIMLKVRTPAGCLALYRFLSSSYFTSIGCNDSNLEIWNDTMLLGRIVLVQIFEFPGQFAELDDVCSNITDGTFFDSIFLQLALANRDFREQGINLFDRSLSGHYGNFYPASRPYFDELVKASAALHNGSSVSYLCAINKQQGNIEQAELYALIGHLCQTPKTYRDLVRYCIKYDLNDYRMFLSQHMVLLKQPYAYYDMYLCCKGLPERQKEAHTYLYYASLMNVSEATLELRKLQESKQFNPLPFLVYLLYLQEIAKNDLSAALCLLVLTIDNSLMPENFSQYVKMLDIVQGYFSNSQIKSMLEAFGIVGQEKIDMFNSYGAYFSIFPVTEAEGLQSNAEVMNGNFAMEHTLLNITSLRDRALSGGLDFSACDAKVRVLLEKMLVSLTNGSTVLESLVCSSWCHSQYFPKFLRERHPEVVTKHIDIKPQIDVGTCEAVHVWLTNFLDPVNLSFKKDGAAAFAFDVVRNKDVETASQALWQLSSCYPSRNQLVAVALGALRLSNRPNPVIFSSICRYLANSGQMDARRYVLLNFGFLENNHYGDSFDQVIGKRHRALMRKIAQQNKGATISELQERAVQEQLGKYEEFVKNNETTESYHSQGDEEELVKVDDTSLFDEGVDDDQDDSNIVLELTEGGNVEAQVQLSENDSGYSVKEQQDEAQSDEDLDNEVRYLSIHHPGYAVPAELRGKNALLNYVYFVSRNDADGLLSLSLRVKNTWRLYHKPNGPRRSYAACLSRSLLKNEPGALMRYLYYVQSHYFKYAPNPHFMGENYQESTARMLASEVLQLNLNSPKFDKFIDEMRVDGIHDFDAIKLANENGYILGSYKFIGSIGDQVSGWSELFYNANMDLNLNRDAAISTREALKAIANTLDEYSSYASGQKTYKFNDASLGDAAQAETASDDDAAEGVDEVIFGDDSAQARSVFVDNEHKRQQGSKVISRILSDNPELKGFLGQEASRLTDATVSKHWINFTFYQTSGATTQNDLLQMLPYTNSILEQLIFANVGKGLMGNAEIGTEGNGITYDPRLVQWHCSKFRIKQEESFKLNRQSPDFFLMRMDSVYSNAQYQINRTIFNILRHAPIKGSNVNLTIEAQANWAVSADKTADSFRKGSYAGNEVSDSARMDHEWQNSFVTEDGYSSLLEKRMLAAYYDHTTVSDDSFYVSAANYYKELLDRVAARASHFRRGSVNEVLDAIFDPSQDAERFRNVNRSVDTAFFADQISTSSHGGMSGEIVSGNQDTKSGTKANYGSGLGFGQNYFNSFEKEDIASKVESIGQVDDQDYNFEPIDAFISIMHQLNSEANKAQDEVVNDAPTENDKMTLSSLQNFLLGRTKLPVVGNGLFKPRDKVLHDELDNEESLVSNLFKKVWNFKEETEIQRLRPKMFYEVDSPLDTVIFSIVRDFYIGKDLRDQNFSAIDLMNRLHSTFGYYYGANDIVDSAFYPVMVECFKRRYYREVTRQEFMVNAQKYYCGFLLKNSEDPSFQLKLVSDYDSIKKIPSDMRETFGLQGYKSFKEVEDLFLPAHYARYAMTDPHYRTLGRITRDQVKVCPEVLCDDSLISPALYDFFQEPDLLEYSKALNGSSYNSMFENMHREIKNLHEKGDYNTPYPPLAIARASSLYDMSLWNNDESGEWHIDQQWVDGAYKYRGIINPEYNEDENKCCLAESVYYTDFEKRNQLIAAGYETDYQVPRKIGVGDKLSKEEAIKANQERNFFCNIDYGRMPYNLFKVGESPMTGPLFILGAHDNFWNVESMVLKKDQGPSTRKKSKDDKDEQSEEKVFDPSKISIDVLNENLSRHYLSSMFDDNVMQEEDTEDEDEDEIDLVETDSDIEDDDDDLDFDDDDDELDLDDEDDDYELDLDDEDDDYELDLDDDDDELEAEIVSVDGDLSFLDDDLEDFDVNDVDNFKSRFLQMTKNLEMVASLIHLANQEDFDSTVDEGLESFSLNFDGESIDLSELGEGLENVMSDDILKVTDDGRLMFNLDALTPEAACVFVTLQFMTAISAVMSEGESGIPIFKERLDSYASAFQRLDERFREERGISLEEHLLAVQAANAADSDDDDENLLMGWHARDIDQFIKSHSTMQPMEKALYSTKRGNNNSGKRKSKSNRRNKKNGRKGKHR